MILKLFLDNYPEPFKRPLSSISPIVMENEDGSLRLVLGGSGGSRIFPSVVQTLLNIDWGMDVGTAIEFGRVHDQLYPLLLDIDSVFPRPIVKDLAKRGHNISGTYPPHCFTARWFNKHPVSQLIRAYYIQCRT